MSNWGQGDIYEQERLSREIDKAHSDLEYKEVCCIKCMKWYSRFLTHKCEESG